MQNFLRRRFESIYPVYWLVLGGLLLLGLTPIGYSHNNYPGTATIVSSILLIGADDRNIVVPPTWTLFHEVLFYLVFAVTLISRRAAVAITIGWTGLIVADLLGLRLPYLPPYIIAPVNLLFVMGGAAALWARQHARLRGGALLAGATIVAVILLHNNSAIAEAPRRLLWGLVWTAAITGLVAIEARRRLPVPPVLLTLGNASFMIYLIHIPMQDQLVHLVLHFGMQKFVTPQAWLIMSTLIIIGLGVAANITIEKRLRNWLRERRQRSDVLAAAY